ncbi:Rrt12p KNAG_0I02470 [Huiozyma naganishii CBS 8797]|uniref:Peptidase S8/S53 domain-containing protein n=1 Tax=Huiozyma naganishii (strain ATCC MYA-139 / BCRC 22969 / CBS 8797 / KCTC 17520 / NBRC 10181 / NCYC 3082 / Yp74L-3) TaxID=1071383 RepID=J7RQH9_HUIN7|nr:hypothetical protein KNAG_0I02470 [Kazachstania naganishii CBS 8797]CCK72033.1 hypothetical protein KNAG_0I02470 [Kazachstania naganishii CBS 8797]
MKLAILLNLFLSSLGGAAAEEFLVTLNDDSRSERFMNSVLSKDLKWFMGGKINKRFQIGELKGLTMNLSHDVLDKIKRHPFVKEVVPNIMVKAFEGDAVEDESWLPKMKRQRGAPRHLARISRRMQLPYDMNNKTRYRDSFNYYYDRWAQGATTRAYILDTGVMRDHKEFEDRVEFGTDCTGEGEGDLNGHGTHVAGLVGSKTFGVAKHVQLVDVKCLDALGAGTLVSILSALEFAVQDCQEHEDSQCVLNMSLGSVKSNILNQAINEVEKKGIVVVVAAGNFNMNACWTSPSSATGAITVGAFDDRFDTIAKFSNWGPCVDIFAPGVNVASLVNRDWPSFVKYSGTSMASPIVCGMVALLLDDGVPPEDIRDYLQELATDGVFKKRTLVFKPGTPNSVLYNGNKKHDDEYEDDLQYPQVELDDLVQELENYSPLNRTAGDSTMKLDNDVSLPRGLPMILQNLQKRQHPLKRSPD